MFLALLTTLTATGGSIDFVNCIDNLEYCETCSGVMKIEECGYSTIERTRKSSAATKINRRVHIVQSEYRHTSYAAQYFVLKVCVRALRF